VVVRGGASSETDNSISFWKGRRFVVVTSATDDDELGKALVSSLADQTVAAIGGDSENPTLLSSLSSLDRVSGSEKLFFGTLAARRFGNFPDTIGLAVDRSTGAAFAEYQFPPPWSERMRAMLIDYGDPGLARNIFNGYAGALAAEHKKCALGPDSVLCKLTNAYIYCAVRNSRLAVISGARRKESATMLARQLAY
jgi:hypothetical protein